MNAMNHQWAAKALSLNARKHLPPALFRGLTRREAHHIQRNFSENLFHPGEPVPRNPADAPFVALLLCGTLREDVRDAQGAWRLFALTFTGELLSPLGPSGSGGRLSALERTVLLTCDRTNFDALATEIPRLRLNLLHLMQGQIAETHRWQTLLGRKTASERVASMLEWFHVRQGERGKLVLPVNRAELGQMSGLTLETVSRQIRRLEKARIIALPQPSRVQVLNPTALHTLTGDAPAHRAA
ncbi:Crp/Fnr family transcriptional regulator [Antarcticimicrobium luteum]|nr:Crp/Fnr family transcriptional regulator [Antarcticimicrobium luteum]